MKKALIPFIFLSLCVMSIYGQKQVYFLEKTTAFLPRLEGLKNEKIDYWFLNVPEEWSRPDGVKIKLAVTIIHGRSKQRKNDPLIFIQGGPGGGTIGSISRWLDNPIRNNRDIVLLDLRGTGFSLPLLCPNLGKKFFRILAEDNSPSLESKKRLLSAIECRDSILLRGIDIQAYNSKSIANDLHALKNALGYTTWNVYAVSYGTRVSFTYLDQFAGDINSLVLDSTIPKSEEYYNYNTSNYVRALNRLFRNCRDNKYANKAFPSLEDVYYQTLRDLTVRPLTVPISKDIIPSGEFVMNAQDMKLAVQQALYDRKLIQVLPLLIYQIKNRNKAVLSQLIGSLGARLNLDYGTYYCVLCQEILPLNSKSKFENDEKSNKKLEGGLVFYKSEYNICDIWFDEKVKSVDTPILSDKFNKDALIFSGSYDPITPPGNGLYVSQQFKRSHLINLKVHSHASSLSIPASQVIADFLDKPGQNPNINELRKIDVQQFITDVHLNRGIVKFALFLNRPFSGGQIAFSISLMLILIVLLALIYFSVRGAKQTNRYLFILGTLAALDFIVAIIALTLGITESAKINIYVLAFGLPAAYQYAIYMLYAFLVLVLLYIFLVARSIGIDRSNRHLKLFSCIVFLLAGFCVVHYNLLF